MDLSMLGPKHADYQQLATPSTKHFLFKTSTIIVLNTLIFSIYYSIIIKYIYELGSNCHQLPCWLKQSVNILSHGPKHA